VICSGNTCRSPMAKVILEQKLKSLGSIDDFEIDSAAYDRPTYGAATKEAREAIKRLYGDDLLASHRSKALMKDLIRRAELILVMCTRMKAHLPPEKTDAFKEYAGEKGDTDIHDPSGGDEDTYFRLANEMSQLADRIVQRLLHQHH
jgi:protein-tyrosine-phosphatase